MLTPEEELELQQLEQEQASLLNEFNSIKQQVQPKEEQQPQQPVLTEQPETSMIEAGARGLAQGASFGLADEATARAESLFTDKPYEQALAESRAEYKLSEEEYPKTTLAGELVGGVGQGLAISALTAGAGAPVAGAQTAAKGSQLLGAINKAFIPLKEGTKLQKIGNVAKIGAISGGLTGFGKSEEKGLDTKKDVIYGAAGGAVIGAGLGAAGQALAKGVELFNKAVDSGNVPYAMKMLRDSIRTGLKGQGYTTMKSAQDISDELDDVAENQIRNKIKQELDDINEAKAILISNLDEPVYVSTELTETIDKLNKLGTSDATDVQSMLSSIANNLKNTDAVTANDVIKLVRNTVDKSTDSATREIVKDLYKGIQSKVYEKLNKEKVYTILQQLKNSSPEEANKVEKVLAKYFKEGFSPEEIKQFKFNFAKKAQQKAQEEADPISSVIRQNKKSAESGKNYLNITDKNALDAIRNSPLQNMDNTLHRILNTSEMIRGSKKGIVSGATPQELLEDVIATWKALKTSAQDTTGGEVANKRITKAIEELKKVNPELAEGINKSLDSIQSKLDVQRYIVGGDISTGRGSKDTGLIKNIIGDAARYSVQGANVAAQVAGAATGGKGIVGGISRPIKASLQQAKKATEKLLNQNPNSSVAKYADEALQNAINQGDEVKQAAVLNTLMQYSTFRDMLKDEEDK